ncbi:ABC transporter permease subunit [Halobacterium salinarum]|uniref:ABC-type transport system permease protein n=2 Tax=Halobacterium salinarum TaxID=2242 RepID=A0A4D6GRV6_HALS9|nr:MULTISPECIES: ABC transporter permease subunit [Halobacterium]MDL0124155.1 ABC transporter permease subunit [Halobacterium salinarum]MDL0136136.1 ABC transporter permease subunit [Halobacterium salinarum]MDL0138575.1 ABC transporter permease subunit [Halobacterium salinarum]QCC44464.1 ABC-type transport system permease protein [Halobacterium salinarum]QRY23228.1 ABC transporter permease [Halobacterium sp. GSL-19]
MKAGNVLRIARWETTRSATSLDRETAIAFVVVAVALAAIVPAVVTTGPTPGEGIYRIGVDDDSPYADVAASDPQLAAVQPGSDADVTVSPVGIQYADTAKGRAALSTLRSATVAYNDAVMADEPDQAAAFPVVVSLTYRPQSIDVTSAQADTDGAGSSTTGGDGGRTDTPSTDDGATGTSPTAGASGGGLSGLLGQAQSGTPSSISPPFPLQSLVFAFAFLLPLNIVIQAYGSSVLAERIDRRGEPLLVAPVSRGDIVAGKTLPYFAGAIALVSVIAAATGAGVLAVLAVAPLAALFLAATFLGAMFARSYKELTFVTVAVSVALTTYAFVPAVFAEVNQIAAISPLTVVVDSITDSGVSTGQFVLSTAPPGLAAFVLFGLGTGVYREEDMFTQLPIPSKLLDALAAPLATPRRAGVWTALFLPFVLVAELFAVALLFVAPVSLSIPVLLGAIAVIEEVAKSIHVFAAFERGQYRRSFRTALAVGAASGVGFFVAEKALLVTQLVGLPGLDIGRAAFAPALRGASPGLLLVAPLVWHVVTAAISAVGAARSRLAYVGALAAAIGVHLAYNIAVVVIALG